MSSGSESDNEVKARQGLDKVLTKWKSTKGDADKRKITSKSNVAKARATRMEMVKKKKEQKAEMIDGYSDDTSSSDSDSEDEDELILQKMVKRMGKPVKTAASKAGRQRAPRYADEDDDYEDDEEEMQTLAEKSRYMRGMRKLQKVAEKLALDKKKLAEKKRKQKQRVPTRLHPAGGPAGVTYIVNPPQQASVKMEDPRITEIKNNILKF